MPTLNKAKTVTKKVNNPFDLPFASITVAYLTKENLWRGFVMPYDITYESNSCEKVVRVLKSMKLQYEKALKKYENPSHLANVPLSDQDDQSKFQSIALPLINSILTEKKFSENVKTIGKDFYAEASLPS